MQIIIKYRFHILWALFFITLIASWPGYIQPDSSSQYEQAVRSVYNDHHPPLMSFLWHYLDKIYPGEGLMYSLQLVFLYLGIAILMVTVDRLPKKEQRWWLYLLFLIIPIYPQLLIYLLIIVKDLQFATSYLLVAASLSYFTVTKKQPTLFTLALLFCLLVYGSAVRYQGQFLAIVPSIWAAAIVLANKELWQKLIAGFVVYAAVFGSIHGINGYIVPAKSKNYSWQYVKLYDLAAISIGANTDLIPAANKTTKFTVHKLHTRFKYPSVDDYVFVKDSIMKITRDPKQMENLYNTWLKEIFKHPWLYIKHRAINLSFALLSRPGYQYVDRYTAHLPVINKLTSAFFYVFMSHLAVIILGIIYFGLAIARWSKTRSAPVLLGLTSTALLMVLILFFMSMAGAPRYTYISVLFIHASHAFAYICFMAKKKNA